MNGAAPSPAEVAAVNPMVQAVETAHQQVQTAPQFSFGQDGATIQPPIVTNADGVTSGGNQFKVNEYGVILGNVGTGGSVQARPLTDPFAHSHFLEHFGNAAGEEV